MHLMPFGGPKENAQSGQVIKDGDSARGWRVNHVSDFGVLGFMISGLSSTLMQDSRIVHSMVAITG